MRRILSVFFVLILFALKGLAQTTTYTQGGLVVDVFKSNPCEGSPNGYLLFTVVATSDNLPAKLQVIFGPPNFFGPQLINVGSSYKFNPSETLPVSDGYEFIIADNTEADVITTFGNPVLFTALPDIVVSDAPTTDLSNSSCDTPDGQIAVTVAGGSKILPGGGLFRYEWETTNGLSGFPITGTTDGNSVLDLATLAGLSGLPGGDYTLELYDSLSNCSEVRNWTITDPQPSLFAITNGPTQAVCQGQDALIQLSGSEFGVSYEVLVNGTVSGVSVTGTGAPLPITVPAGAFVNGQTLVVRAILGSCIPRVMTGFITMTINPLPTISGVVVGSVCAGNSPANLNYTTLTGGPTLYSIDFDLTAQGQGFVDVVDQTLPPTPIGVVVPVGAAPGNYNAILTVRNGTTGCSSAQIPITISVIGLPVPTIAGPNDVCVNSTGNVYTTQPGMSNYIWTVTGGTITAGGGTSNNTVTVTWPTTGAGSVSVNYTQNTCPATAPTVYPVTIKPLAVPTIVSGPNDVCLNSTGNVYTTQGGKTNYVWTVSGGTITAGGTPTDNTATVTWTTAGARSISVNYSESGCPAATPFVYNVNVKTLPTPTIASGPNDVCINSTGNVYTTQPGKTNYAWTVTGGTITAGGTSTDNTVTVTWNTAGAQSVSVNYSENGCAAVTPTVYPVNVKPLPVPTVVSGPNDVCVNSTGNVYTTQAGMSNYVWTVSAGGTITAGGGATNNTVTVTWNTVGARSVSVNYTQNGCTTPTPGTYAVNVKALPTPTIASGPNDVCVNSTGNVYTTQAGKTNYVWTVSAGGTITAGGTATDNTVTVTWTTAGARSVSINYSENGCAAATPATYAVNVKALATPTIASGPNDVCINSTGNVYTTQAGKSNYVWTIVGGTITAGGGATNNTVTVTWTTAGAQSVSINYSENGCAAATATVYPVNVKPLAVPTITSGPNDVCVNSTGNVYTTQAGKTNYVWTVSAGGTITAGGGAANNTVTVTWTTAGARSVSVNYNESGCPAATATVYPVNVKPLATPTIVSGPNDVCANSTGNVYTTQAGKTNYVWTVNGGTITAGGTPTDNTATVTWTATGARSISVNYAESGCPAATPVTYAVNVKALPTPTVASGPNDVCVNATGNVYTTQAGKSNYVWTVSAGGTITAGGTATDNTVTVTWATAGAQSISINYTENGCTAATPSTYAVNVKALPTPTITSGPADVCVNSTGNVYATQTGKTNYVWTVSAGGTITAGGGATDNTVTVTWTTAGPQTVTVNYTETGCTTATPGTLAVNVDPVPSVTSATLDPVCEGATTASLTYTAATGTPNQFSIDFNGVAETAGLTDIVGAFTASPISITIPGTVAAGTYNGTITVSNTTTGCSSTSSAISLQIVPQPNMTGIIVGSACAGSASTQLNYGALVGSPDLFSVDFDDAGFTDVVNAPITASPLTIPLLTTALPGTYTATLIVTNTTTGCNSAGIPITISIIGRPTPVIGGPDEVCENSTGNVYSTLTGKAPYTWTVVGGTVTAGGGTNDNSVTVTWTTVGSQSVSVNYTDNTCNAATPTIYPVEVNATPTITNPVIAQICAGVTSASLSYGAVTGLPDEFSIDFDAAAQSAGLVDIVNEALTASPVTFTIPGTVPAGLYSGMVTVRNSTTGCVSSQSPVSITITPSPTATISGTASICNGSQTPITINFTGTGPWTFEYSDGTTTFPAVSPVNSITFNVQPTANTTYTVESVSDNGVPACNGIVSGSAVITVNQNPAVNLPVDAAPDPLCSGGIADVTVENSELGVSYQLRNNVGNVPVGPAVVGTGGTINLPTGALLSTQTFNILATATGCTPVQLTNTVTVNVTGAINPSLAVTAIANSICEGSAAIIQVINAENGVLYQLRDDATNTPVGPPVAGTGTTIDLPAGVLTATTSFNVLATNGTCSIELTDIETVTVNVNPNPGLAVTVAPDPVCVGGSSVVTVAGSQSGVSYQLRTNPGNVNVGPAVVSTGGLLNLPTGPLTVTTSFNILASSGVCTPVQLTAIATVTVSGTIDASLSVTAVPATICAGMSTDIEITNSEAGITYQLRNDADDTPVGAAVTGTGGTITLPTGNLSATTAFNVLADNGTCSIELTDIETVTVDPAPNAALVVDATLNPLCTGGSSAVTVELSQLGVSYQLRNDAGDIDIGLAVVGTGGTITLPTGPLTATTTFNILATSGVCAPVELTQLATITVGGSLNAGLNVASSASPICEGSSTFIRVLLSETGVDYQLRNGIVNVGIAVTGDGGTINLPTGNITATTTYNVVASNGTCSIELTDTETVNVNPAPDVTLAVAPASGLICSGTSTSIVVTGSELGISYQLRNNADNSPIGPAVAGTNGNISLPTGNLTTSTTFNVFAIAGSCSAQLTATASVAIRPIGDPACGPGPSDCANFSAIIPTIVTQPSCNDRDAGEVSFSISRSNGTPTTFRVIWSYNGTDQTKFTSGTVSFDDLNSGLYRYTVIDEGNGMSCGPVDFFLDLKTQVVIQDKKVISNVTCFEGTDGNVELTVDGTSTGEYWYKYVVNGQESVAQTFTPGAPLPSGLPADDDDFIIIKVDESFAFACPDTAMVRIRHVYPKIDFAVASTEVSTCNGTDGAIQVTAIGGGNTATRVLQIRLKKEVPLSTDPSGYVVVADFEDVSGAEKAYADLAQGNYVVDVKDESDCIQSKPIAIQAPGQVPLAFVDIIATDASCANEGASGTIQVTINEPGIYEVAVSQDQVNVPADDAFVAYNSPSLPSITFNNLARGRYFLYIKSSTTECPTRSDVISIGGVYAISDFDIISNCENVNLTLNNITGQEDRPFTIRVFNNNDKFFKIDSLTASSIPQSKSVSFVYAAPLQHKFLTEEGTYRFVMIQNQTTGAGTCTIVSDTVVYDVRDQVGIVLGQIKPSFPDPKRTGSIEIENVTGGQRFVSGTNELYYEVSLSTADDDIVVIDWEQLKLNPQNKFSIVFDYLPPGVYRVKVRDASGCTKVQDVEIGLDPSVYVPNIFTPNDDNVNDEFEVLNLPLDGKHKLIVSNRWGNEVYSSKDYREGNFWNAEGTSDGIYFYRLQVEGGGTFTGWVEILRGNKP